MVLIHNEGPRLYWKLAVVEELIVGGDGLVRAANIRTSNGRTNRPIVKLYPLEVSSSGEVTPHISDYYTTQSVQPDPTSLDAVVASCRPTRASARKARERVAEWADTLLAPPEDVGN